MDWAQESGRAALFHPSPIALSGSPLLAMLPPDALQRNDFHCGERLWDQGKQPSRQSAGPDDCASAFDAVSQLLATNESPGRMFLLARQ
jgi:hypothetical protein